MHPLTFTILASLTGKNIVVARMTSSGKSLCYNVPVLEALSQNLLSCALYLFSTKALAQDQLRAWKIMTSRYDASIEIGIYDGDTSHQDMTWLRENARLPVATSWYIWEKRKTLTCCIIESEKYSVIDTRRNEVIEEIEESKAFFQVYEGVVYMNQGRTYLVTELNISSKTAFCREANLDYYTKIQDYTDIHVIGGNLAVWIEVSQTIKTAVEKIGSFRSGLHAACHALLHVVPLYVRCNYSDLAPEFQNPHGSRYYPTRILLYDKHSGGAGVSIQIRPYFMDVLIVFRYSSSLISAENGCPDSTIFHEFDPISRMS